MRRHRHVAFAVVATAVAGLAGGVAVAASTNTLPFAADRGQTTAATAASTTSAAPSSANANASAPGPALAPEPNASNGNGPDAIGSAKFGLCTAYAAGEGTTNGNKADSTAFQALAAAAGGANNIAALCADATPGRDTQHGEGGKPPNPSLPAGPAHDNAATNADVHGPSPDPGGNGNSHRP